MNDVTKLEKKLIEAGKRDKPSDKVPYAFEKRIMAVLQTLPTPDLWTVWAGPLWRATVPCLALMMILAVWSFAPGTSQAPQQPQPAVASSSINLPQEMDNTVLAAIDQTADQFE